jgi:hypothetical protein
MVSISDELKERNILKLILIVRFTCATLDVGHLLPQYRIRVNLFVCSICHQRTIRETKTRIVAHSDVYSIRLAQKVLG